MSSDDDIIRDLVLEISQERLVNTISFAEFADPSIIPSTPKAKAAWEKLTSPENYELLKRYVNQFDGPPGMNPTARKFFNKALEDANRKSQCTN
jgi:hypothetical protein